MELQEIAVLNKLQLLIDQYMKLMNTDGLKIDMETDINASLSQHNGGESFTISMIMPEIEDLFGVVITDVYGHFDKVSDLVTFLIFENIEKVLKKKNIRTKEVQFGQNHI